MKNDRIRTLVVDDHRLMREGMISLLLGDDSIEVVGDAESGEDLLNVLEKKMPDVILMDIMMGGMTGIEATRWIREQNIACKVILVSMEVTKEYLSNGIRCGIDGYMSKNSPGDEVVKAIKTVYCGEKYFPESVRHLVFEDFSFREKLKAPEKKALPNDLTKREYEVLGHVAQGKSNSEIAEELFISVKTVDTHKTHILEKMNFKNIAELVIYAVKNKIVTV